jgi:hypothetical protein
MAEPFVNHFFSELQKQYLKPLGYKKERHTFFREHAEYIERIQCQGSPWNSSDSPWRFYINVGIQFHNLPRRQPDRDFPNTHAHSRIEKLIPNSEPYFELTENNSHEMLSKIADLLSVASGELTNAALSAYPKCKEGKVVWFGVT